MGLLQWLFGDTPDNRDRREEDAERKLSTAMPMAGAGAELAGVHSGSETENELRESAAETSKQ